MSTQEILQLPKDQQWEYAALTWSRTAGLFGALGARENLIWSSTLEDEGEVNFQQSAPDLLYRVGRSGWELASSTTTSNIRGGTTHEMVIFFVFKQRVAASEEQYLAQIIDPVALLKQTNNCLRQKNPSRAIGAVNRALSFGPQKSELFYLTRGRAYLALGNEAQALEDFSSSIQANQSCSEAYMERANIHFDHKDYQGAVSNYSDAFRSMNISDKELLAQMRYNRG